MIILSRAWRRSAVLAVVLGALGMPAAAEANILVESGGHAVGIAVPASSRPPGGGAASAVALSYHGGPVLHSSAPYLIFWDPAGSIPGSSEALFKQYFTDLAADSGTDNGVSSVIRQFTDGSGYAAYQQSFAPGAQAIVDSHPFPSSGCNPSAPAANGCLTDSQVTRELTALTSAQGLPAGTGPNAPIYFVVLPQNVDECVAGSCASRAFCGYHSYTTTTAGQNLLYAVIPMISLAPAEYPKLCQYDGNNILQEPNRSLADVLIPTLSHEDNEIITDPLFTGWFASNTSESGDMCSSTGPFDPLASYDPNAFLPVLGGSVRTGSLYDQVINRHRYYVQSEWSNGAQGCMMRPASASLSARFKASPGGPGSTVVSFAPAGSSSSAGYSSVTWSFGDGTSNFSAGSAPSPVAHTFPGPGAYSVSLTLVDRQGNLAIARQTLTVGSGLAHK